MLAGGYVSMLPIKNCHLAGLSLGNFQVLVGRRKIRNCMLAVGKHWQLPLRVVSELAIWNLMLVERKLVFFYCKLLIWNCNLAGLKVGWGKY